MSPMPVSARIFLSAVCGKYGCASTCTVCGFSSIVSIASRKSSCGKLERPIARTLSALTARSMLRYPSRQLSVG